MFNPFGAWTAEDVSSWANAWLVLSLVAGVVSTFAVIWAGNIKEAALKKDVAASNERAAKLEREAADARLELARIDPMNLPIKSLRADVYLLIRGNFNSTALGPNALRRELFGFFLSDESGARDSHTAPLALLSCRDVHTAFASHLPEISLLTEEPGTPSGKEFELVFDWPGSDFVASHIASHPEIGLWIDGDVSTAELDQKNPVAVAALHGLPAGLEIISGSCRLTINGSLGRIYLANKATENGRVLFNARPSR